MQGPPKPILTGKGLYQKGKAGTKKQVLERDFPLFLHKI